MVNYPTLSTKVQQRRMRIAGHCVKYDDEVANKLVLWQPTDGHVNRGRQKMTYVDNLLQDTGREYIKQRRFTTAVPVAPLAGECAMLAVCQMKLRY